MTDTKENIKEVEKSYVQKYTWRQTNGLGVRATNLTGKRFGELAVIEPTGKEIANGKQS